MRVVCINDNTIYDGKPTHSIIKGNIYTVIDTEEFNRYQTQKGMAEDGVYYKLIETGRRWIHSKFFIPLNENQQDEVEIAEQRDTVQEGDARMMTKD